MAVIDAHNHPDWHGHDLERFLANMDANGIDRCWLLNWECPAHEYSPHYQQVLPAALLGSTTGPLPFTRCLSYVERSPGRFVLGYCPDPRRPDACAALRAAHDIYGARVCGELKCRMLYDNPDALLLFRCAGDLGMPVTFHLEYNRRQSHGDPWTEWWGGGIDNIERVLQACPNTNFLGHAPGFWLHISNDDLYQRVNYPPADAPVVPGGRIEQLMRKYPNLHCDISAGSGFLALNRDHDYTRRFLAEFQDRVLFARDYFDSRHADLIRTLALPAAVSAKILGGNAERLLADTH